MSIKLISRYRRTWSDLSGNVVPIDPLDPFSARTLEAYVRDRVRIKARTLEAYLVCVMNRNH
jgi:hypothetical protein